MDLEKARWVKDRVALAAGAAAGLIAVLAFNLPNGPFGLVDVAYSQVPSTPTGVPTGVPGPATNTPTPVATNTPAPAATNTPSPTATGTPAPTNTPIPSGGGGPATSAPSTTAGGQQALTYNPSLSVSQLAQDPNAQPANFTTTINGSQGATIVNNNVALSIPPGATTSGNVTVTFNAVQRPPNLGLAPFLAQVGPSGSSGGLVPTIPGGPAQFSINGTIFDASLKDESTGKLITTFPTPLTLLMKYNAADLGIAKGNPNILTVAYMIDAQSPALENPLNFPIGTWVFAPPSAVKLDTTAGTIVFNTQALGSFVSVFSNPVGYVQNTSATGIYSSFDPASSQQFSTKPQFSYFQVAEPQIGDRLLVIDPDTGNYGYVNAREVGPAGPPPDKTSAGVVRGLTTASGGTISTPVGSGLPPARQTPVNEAPPAPLPSRQVRAPAPPPAVSQPAAAPAAQPEPPKAPLANAAPACSAQGGWASTTCAPSQAPATPNVDDWLKNNAPSGLQL